MHSSLPTYKDDEVKVFHPFFETELRAAIGEQQLESELEVVHHWTTSTFPGIIDFVIRNTKSKKILLPIELKKTPADLRSLGRAQARRYLENLGIHRGSNFYCASNLEEVELFLVTKDRVLTVAQMLSLRNGSVGIFTRDEASQFKGRLRAALAEVLDLVAGNDGTRFASNISGLLAALETSLEDRDSWRQAATYYSFDLIRGGFRQDAILGKIVNQWKSSDTYFSTPQVIPELINQIDFSVIADRTPKGRFNESEIRQIIAGAYENDSTSTKIEDFVSVVNEIAQMELLLPGVVETTPPLARLMAWHLLQGRHGLDSKSQVLLEPGCGAGNLIAAVKEMQPELMANQVIGVEREELYREALALRVGFLFAESLRVGIKADLRISSIDALEPTDTESVSSVIMNPPFIRGIDCTESKSELTQRSMELTGKDSEMMGGQLGYECAFLELVTNLVKDGTRIASIFPLNALVRPDSKIVRSFLLSKFGLRQIIVYKGDGIFQGIQKNTVILIGEKNIHISDVEIFTYRNSLEDLDFSPEQRLVEDQAGRKKFVVKREELLASIDTGWKPNLTENYSIVLEELNQSLGGMSLEPIGNETIRRGQAGNYGGSDFIFNAGTSANKSRSERPDQWELADEQWIFPAAKTSDQLPRLLDANSGESAISLSEFLANDESGLGSKAREFLEKLASKSAMASAASRRQRKTAKDIDAVKKILKSTRVENGYFVIVPRGQRRWGQIGISANLPSVFSTNFFLIRCMSYQQAVVLGSWLLSVFGQVQLEALGISQEGMRKLEESQLVRVLVPKTLKVTDAQFTELDELFKMSSPIDLYDPQATDLDYFLAERFFSKNPSLEVDKLFKQLSFFCEQRLNFGK